MKRCILLYSILIILISGCTKSLPQLDGVDLDAWKNDRGACLNTRFQYLSPFDQQREKLKALSEMEIINLLGKPDVNELYKRNQKFYYYYFQPGPICSNPDSAARRLAIRFNAMGRAKEVIIE